MNDPTLIGPCAEYEHDLVEFLDGTLAAERRHVVGRHVETCGRCRAWQAEFAALDARLAASLPRPALSAEFERRLRERLVARAQAVVRPDLRDAADHEHRQQLDAIRSSARRRGLLDAIASAAVTACILVSGPVAISTGLAACTRSWPAAVHNRARWHRRRRRAGDTRLVGRSRNRATAGLAALSGRPPAHTRVVQP